MLKKLFAVMLVAMLFLPVALAETITIEETPMIPCGHELVGEYDLMSDIEDCPNHIIDILGAKLEEYEYVSEAEHRIVHYKVGKCFTCLKEYSLRETIDYEPHNLVEINEYHDDELDIHWYHNECYRCDYRGESYWKLCDGMCWGGVVMRNAPQEHIHE